MVTVKLGNTGIIANKNGFGALPIQRIDTEHAVKLIHMALDGGVNFFDTARAYSDSEKKLGIALEGVTEINIILRQRLLHRQRRRFWRIWKLLLTC